MPSISPPSSGSFLPDQSQPKQREAARRVVLFTVFLDILGFGIIIPQLGIYAAQFGGSPTVITILAATYSAMGFLFAPFWGRLSDRIGRRPVLLWSVLGSAISYFIFALSGSMPMLFISRALAGITGANIAAAQVYLTDVTSPQDRAKTFGIFGAIFGVGFAIGPTIGGLLAHLPYPWGGNLGIGALTALLSLFNWGLAWKRLPETLSPQMREDNRARQAAERTPLWAQVINIGGFRRAFALPGLHLLIAISFITIVAFATLQGTFTIYLIAKYVRPQTQTFIAQNPGGAVREARRHAGEGNKAPAAVSGGHEGGGAAAPAVGAGGDATPYSRAMGGDFPRADSPLFGKAPAPDLSWRRVEQVLVQPRAAQLVNWIFTTIGIVALLVQGGLIGPLKKRFGEINLVIYGTLMMALALALVPMPQHFIWQFPIAALIAIGNGVSAPVMTALVSLLSPEAVRGEIIGVFQSTQSLGRIIGPILGGLLFEYVSPGAPYFAGGAIMLLAFFITLKLRGRTMPEHDAPEAQDTSKATAPA